MYRFLSLKKRHADVIDITRGLVAPETADAGTGVPPVSRFRDLPIRRKLVITGLVTSAVALVLTTTMFVISAYFIGRRNTRTGLQIQATIFANAMPSALAARDASLATDLLKPLLSTPTIDMACAYAMPPALVAQAIASPQRFSCPSQPPPDQEVATGATVVVVRPVLLDGQRVGTLYLRGNLVRLAEQLRLEVIAVVWGALIGLATAAVIAARLQRQIADPVLSLSRTAASISRGGDYSLRAEKHGNDEVGALVDTFNSMVAAVEERDGALRDVNRTKDEFLAALSHELRTPLTAIVGWLRILRDNRHDAGVVDQALDRLDRNAHAQARLIDDLLEVSRIVTGKIDLQLSSVDLGHVVETAVEVNRPVAEAKGITLSLDLGGRPCFVSGDPDRLQQIVSNLLSNAVKFTEAGGCVDVTLTAAGTSCAVAVSDTGAGIAPEFLPRIFDRFRQADGSVTRHHGGLGLGLSIARDLVELHGGRIEASSKGLKHGSTLTVVLPRLSSFLPREEDAAPPPAPRLDGLSILVADDDADARIVARAALVAAGARVELASDGARALTLVAQREFDVLVCDIAMPDVDGYSLLRQVRERQQARGEFTPAVAVTAHAAAGDREQASRAGYQSFVAKPYDFSALCRAVATAKSRRPVARDLH
jgi:signal transduction histidine kinase/ActR/RegA family two-component response regulator